jgi:hypothetical protein
VQSLIIPDTFRNPNQYTADEILAALQGVTGSRKLSFRYELLDENNVVKRELDTVTSGKISQDWLADIKRTASFSLRSGFTDPIDYLKDRIKPWARLHMPPKAIPQPDPVLPPAPQDPPHFGGMTDDFESAEKSAVWDTYSEGVSNVGGKLRIPTKTSFPAAVSNQTWSLTGSQVAAEMVTVPSIGGGTDVASSMVINSNTQGTNLTIQYRLTGFGSDNKLEFINFDNVFQDPGFVSVDYDPSEHRWVRIREAAGTVFWETSRTGLPGTWQLQRDEPTPTWVTAEDETLELFFQCNGDASDDDFAEWDNLNLTPEGVETAFMPQPAWSNNFNGTPGVTGEAITPNNSARHGNALDDVRGVAIYDDTHTADGGKAAKLGSDDAVSDGLLVARVRNALTDWSLRCYFYIPTSGYLLIQPDGAVANASNNISFDGSGGLFTLGSATLPAAVSDNLVDALVKLEIITTETLTIYRLFWTDPSGDSPDYVTSEDNTGRDPLLTVTVNGGGASTTPPVWFDNLLITEPRTYQRFTDDSVNFVEWPQGVFVLSSPQRESDAADVVSREIQGYDLAQVLQDDQVPERFSTANLLRVDDNFTRDVTGGWGTSDDGTVWLQAAANTDVGVVSATPGYAFMRLLSAPSTIRLQQAGNTAQEILVDSQIYFRTTTTQTATGAGIISGAIFRLFSTGDYYRLRTIFNTDGSFHMSVTGTKGGALTQYGDDIDTGVGYTAGTYINVRAQCINNVIRGRAWRDGTSEPAGWMIEEEIDIVANRVTHGYTGVSASTFGGNTNVNPEIRWDVFQLNPNPANTYTGVVDHILTESNLPKKVTANAATIPVPKEWEAGTSKRQIIGDLLTAINYESLSFDEDGFAVVKPYVSPQSRGAEYTYQDDELSVMYPEVMQEYDLFGVPNRWIMTLSDPDRETITVDFTNSDPASPTSTVRRGRTITSFEQAQDADSEATMIARVARLAFESSQVFEAIEFSSGLMPIHSGNDVLALSYDPLSINGQYAEVSWDMDLTAGAKMTHRARRVISLVAATDPGIISDDVVITGSLEAGNIAAGVTAVVPVANKPTKVAVSGLNLQGTGPVRVIATAESAVPGSTFREVCTANHTPFGFSIWVYRTNTTSTNIHWLALRGA